MTSLRIIEKPLEKWKICNWKIQSSHKKSKVCLIPEFPTLSTWQIPNNENMDISPILNKDDVDHIGFFDQKSEIVEKDIPKSKIGTSGRH